MKSWSVDQENEPEPKTQLAEEGGGDDGGWHLAHRCPVPNEV